jgi:hypothetical protein
LVPRFASSFFVGVREASMWRKRQDFVRAILAITCLAACFTIVVLSVPDGSRSRRHITTAGPGAVTVLRATIPDRPEIIPAAYTGSVQAEVGK